MTGNGEGPQVDATAIVSGVYIGLRANGNLHMETVGQPLTDIMLVGMLAKAQDALLHRKQSSIVVPRSRVGELDAVL